MHPEAELKMKYPSADEVRARPADTAPTTSYLRNTQRRDDDCAEKARFRGQRTFTLVEQDVSSVRLICEWIKENIETAPAGKLHDALAHAISMREFHGRRPAT